MEVTADGPLAERVAALEARVAALETPPRALADPDQADAGIVRYSGDVHLRGDVEWSIVLDAKTALDLDDEPRVAVLSALGHPVRLRLVHALLTGGPSGTTALQEAAGLASSGQLYHHLRALTHCRLVEQDGRGSYRIAPQRVVPTLVLLTAAADVAGQLR